MAAAESKAAFPVPLRFKHHPFREKRSSVSVANIGAIHSGCDFGSRAWDPRKDFSQPTHPYNIFNVQRHLTSARTHRAFRTSAMQAWREATVETENTASYQGGVWLGDLDSNQD